MTSAWQLLLVLALTAATAAGAAEEISWRHWELDAFNEARERDKIILVSVGMEGCAACARMESLTYTDSAVIDLINRNFIAVEVDAEARPDIGERYSDWAWPATIFLAPDATQVLAIRGNRIPRNFIPILKDLISKHAAGLLEADPRSPYAAPPAPAETDLTRMRDDLRAQIDRSLNRKYGGWGRGGIGGEQSGSRLRQLYLRAHLYEDIELHELALKGSAGFLNAIDPVWGGVYIGFFPADMEVPGRFAGLRAIPEKRILVQANAITAFAIGYQHTGERKISRWHSGNRPVSPGLDDGAGRDVLYQSKSRTAEPARRYVSQRVLAAGQRCREARVWHTAGRPCRVHGS